MSERLFFPAAVALLIAGTLYRLFPIATGQPALSQFFVTEDGYLMLTVARNMAIGLGMSVADGTIATNGVQPMATFLFAIPYALAGGDKVASLAGVHLIAAALALAGAVAVRAFAARALAPQGAGTGWPWLAAALWFTGPLLLLHTMNALETGLYTLFVLVTLLQFARLLEKGAAAGRGDALALGALSGLTFLARNDGAFLVVAIFLVWTAHGLFGLRLGLAATLRRVVPAGLLSLAIAAPWLLYNFLNFGSIVPISGASQSLGASFGQNAPLLPAKLFEHAFPMLPVPQGLERAPLLAAALLAVLLAVLLWAAVRAWRAGGRIRLVLAAYLIYGGMLVFYYGFFFGAAHFLSRYLAPLAPLLIAASLVPLRDLGRALGRPQAAVAAGLAALALSVALLARLLLPGVHEQGHFQVVRWIEENVADETWVGAVQTGTLGYWHDRTINLDGKVNPEALAVLRREGHVLGYVSESEIDYLADWNGIAGWRENGHDLFDARFALVVDRPEENLAVYARTGPGAAAETRP